MKTIQQNLEISGLGEYAVVRRVDAFDLLRQTPEEAYDFIYIAPPQYKGLWRKALEAVDENTAWVADDGIVIVQIDPSEKETVTLQHLRPYDERRYGNTMLWFFEHSPSMSEE